MSGLDLGIDTGLEQPVLLHLAGVVVAADTGHDLNIFAQYHESPEPGHQVVGIVPTCTLLDFAIHDTLFCLFDILLYQSLGQFETHLHHSHLDWHTSSNLHHHLE